MKSKKGAFSMIELVFVIVVLGILASLAIPKFAATRVDAQIAKARTTIASVRSGIVSERQTRIITGDSEFIDAGNGTDELDDGGLFGGVLMYPITDSATNGNWTNTGYSTTESATYKFKISNVDVEFTYTQDTGRFDCNTSNTTYGTECQQLVN